MAHNRLQLFNTQLDYLCKIDINDLNRDAEIASNPIQSIKAITQKKVIYLIAVNMFSSLTLVAIVNKSLKILCQPNRFTPGRLNGCCMHNQYSSKFLLFGFGEFSEYVIS
jgi:hypothetical protein